VTDSKQNKASADTQTLEQQMEALASIVEKLENPDVALEESLSLYEKGRQLVAAASRSLDTAEQRVALVSESGEVQDFNS